jgi:NAD-dependent SIR2 family protein deacetylase
MLFSIGISAMKQPAIKKKITRHDTETCQVPECEICKQKRPFRLPKEIVSAYQVGNLIIFAGAGVGTESVEVYPSTFYASVKHELGLPEEERISFSKLMSLYCSHPRSHKDLFQAIQKRIEYIKSFPELYRRATEFHRELSTIPHLDEIFTTNWDDFFERECDATPIVTGQDFAVFQDVPGRKVFKLHGSIYNYGSIVATEDDYRKCYRRLSTGIIGAKLKMLLMSKTLVFFGFSFNDEDFQKLYNLLKKEVGGLVPRSYVVTLDEQAKEKLNLLGVNATPIITSASFFVEQLKKRLVKDKLMLPDQQYDGIEKVLRCVYAEHMKLSRLSIVKHPDSLYSLFYQDGLIHAFERLLITKKSGQNSCAQKTINFIESYSKLIKERLHEGNYPDVAYFTGYHNGLLYFLAHRKYRQLVPMYFLFGCADIGNFKQYIRLEKNAARLHKSAHKVALRLAKRTTGGLVLHRKPFL